MATLGRVRRRGEHREKRQRNEGFEDGGGNAESHGKRGKEQELGSHERARQSLK